MTDPMALCSCYNIIMLEVYLIKQEGSIGRTNFEKLLGCLPEDKKSRVLRFIRPEDRQRFLISTALLLSVIRGKLRLDPKKISFSFGKYGKPFLPNHPDFHFNLSESGCWAACAIAGSEVGIDVQEIRQVNLDIAKNYFAGEEYTALLKKPDAQRQDFFFELWSLKESYIKAVGCGLHMPLNQFSITKENGRAALKTKTGPGNYFFKQYSVDPRYKLAVCRQEEIINDRLIFYSADDLLKMLQ